MKKLLFASATLFTLGTNAQTMPNCSMMCVISISIDTVNNEMEVMFFNGDSVPINYPTIQVVDMTGDTIGNPAGMFYFFQQGQGYMLHEIPTTVSSIPQPFYGTVIVTDQIQDSSCIFQVPMSCPMSVLEPEHNSAFTVYPNPATDQLTISLPSKHSGRTTVSISNTLGEVYAGTLLANNGRINLSVADLACGMYFITVTVGEERYIQRVIRQ